MPLRKTSKLLTQGQAQKPPQPEQTLVATQPHAGAAGALGQDGFWHATPEHDEYERYASKLDEQAPKKQQEVELQISRSPKKHKALEDGKSSSGTGASGSGVAAASLPLAIGDAEPFKPKLRTSAAEPSASKSVAEIEQQTFLAFWSQSLMIRKELMEHKRPKPSPRPMARA